MQKSFIDFSFSLYKDPTSKTLIIKKNRANIVLECCELSFLLEESIFQNSLCLKLKATPKKQGKYPIKICLMNARDEPIKESKLELVVAPYENESELIIKNIGVKIAEVLENPSEYLKENKMVFRLIIANAQERNLTPKTGLENKGCTCYLNSCLQTIYMLPYLRAKIYECDVDLLVFSEENRKVFNLTGEDDFKRFDANQKLEKKQISLIKSLQEVFCAMETFNLSYLSPTKLFLALGWSIADTLVQEDAHEFFRSLLVKIEERFTDLNKLKYFLKQQKDGIVSKDTSFFSFFEELDKKEDFDKENPIKKLMEGQSQTETFSEQFNYKNEITESFYDIQLLVKGNNNLYDAFKHLVAPIPLIGENALLTEKHGKIDATKKISFKEFPPILVLHLRRFEFDPETFNFSKVNENFEFYSEIDLNNFCKNTLDCSYKLFAVIVHKGVRLDSGHYFNLIDPSLDSSWWLFNDEQIIKLSKIDEKEPFTEFYGGNVQNAYFLVYIRRDWVSKILLESTTISNDSTKKGKLILAGKELQNSLRNEKFEVLNEMVKRKEKKSQHWSNTLLFVDIKIRNILKSHLEDIGFELEAFDEKSFEINVNKFWNFLRSVAKGNSLAKANIKANKRDKPVIYELNSIRILERFNNNFLVLCLENSKNTSEASKELLEYFRNKLKVAIFKKYFDIKTGVLEENFDSTKTNIFKELEKLILIEYDIQKVSEVVENEEVRTKYLPTRITFPFERNFVPESSNSKYKLYSLIIPNFTFTKNTKLIKNNYYFIKIVRSKIESKENDILLGSFTLNSILEAMDNVGWVAFDNSLSLMDNIENLTIKNGEIFQNVNIFVEMDILNLNIVKVEKEVRKEGSTIILDFYKNSLLEQIANCNWKSLEESKKLLSFEELTKEVGIVKLFNLAILLKDNFDYNFGEFEIDKTRSSKVYLIVEISHKTTFLDLYGVVKPLGDFNPDFKLFEEADKQDKVEKIDFLDKPIAKISNHLGKMKVHEPSFKTNKIDFLVIMGLT